MRITTSKVSLRKRTFTAVSVAVSSLTLLGFLWVQSPPSPLESIRADEADPRAGSSSQYVYRGLRERYGVVRRREPILPFDLVIKGSFTDLSIGAFPRIREPRKTPDAFLYK